MKKNISILLIALFAYTGINFAQSNAINGVWFISEMHQGGQAYPINMHFVLKKEGIINVSGIDAGTWTTNESDNTLTITCDYLNFIEGSNTIETLNDSELKLKNTNGEINSLTKISLPKDKELDNDITGEWMLESAETNGETNSILLPVDFNKNGVFYMQGRVLGIWDYNQSDKTVLFDTRTIKGKHSILKHDQKHLVIKGEDGTLSFSNLNRESILKENTESGVLGTWKMNTSDNPDIMLRLLTFKSPELFSLLEKKGGMTYNTAGTWLFSKTDQTLFLTDQTQLLVGEVILQGLTKLISLTDKTLTLENNGVRYTMTKEEDQSNKVERLNFTQADFYDDESNSYENDASKLPWQDYYQFMTELSQVKQLVYSFETLMGSSNTFDIKTLTAEVSANIEEEKLSIDNIFNGYDRYNLPEDSAMPDNNYESYNSLYPLDSSVFRVVGTDEITTPAGTFTCTVVEATESFGQLIKLWMINDKPGIIAKLVKDSAEGRDDYVIYQLQEIK